MTKYDIIQVGDDDSTYKIVERKMKEEGISYKFETNLTDLATTLTESSAQLYVIDGMFPRIKGGQIELLVQEAFSLIRKSDPKAKIVLVSSRGDIEELAKKLEISYIEKGSAKAQTAYDLAERLKEMFSN